MGVSRNLALSCDLRIGMAASRPPFVPQDGFSTVELGFDDWRPAAAAISGAGSGDPCVRLGRVFSVPGAAGYAEAVERCRLAPAVFFLEFPPAFRYSPESRRHLDRVLRDLESLPLAVLFFDPGWYSARVIEGLKERDVALCLADLPSVPGAPPSIDVVTASLAYVRFYAGGRGGLQSWKPRLEALAARAGRLRIVFEPEREAEARGAALWWEGSSPGPDAAEVSP